LIDLRDHEIFVESFQTGGDEVQTTQLQQSQLKQARFALGSVPENLAKDKVDVWINAWLPG